MKPRVVVDNADLSAYVRTVSPETTTVRYTPFRYTGWRRLLRRILGRPVESPTYEFQATLVPDQPFLDDFAPNAATSGFSYSVKAVSPLRVVDAEDAA